MICKTFLTFLQEMGISDHISTFTKATIFYQNQYSSIDEIKTEENFDSNLLEIKTEKLIALMKLIAIDKNEHYLFWIAKLYFVLPIAPGWNPISFNFESIEYNNENFTTVFRPCIEFIFTLLQKNRIKFQKMQEMSKKIEKFHYFRELIQKKKKIEAREKNDQPIINFSKNVNNGKKIVSAEIQKEYKKFEDKYNDFRTNNYKFLQNILKTEKNPEKFESENVVNKRENLTRWSIKLKNKHENRTNSVFSKIPRQNFLNLLTTQKENDWNSSHRYKVSRLKLQNNNTIHENKDDLNETNIFFKKRLSGNQVEKSLKEELGSKKNKFFRLQNFKISEDSHLDLESSNNIKENKRFSAMNKTVDFDKKNTNWSSLEVKKLHRNLLFKRLDVKEMSLHRTFYDDRVFEKNNVPNESSAINQNGSRLLFFLTRNKKFI